MPFDPPVKVVARSRPGRDRTLVAGWLFTLCGMVLVMVTLGGATRLTGSGLSIMEWAPLSGALPPLTHAEWQRLFSLYQTIPQAHLLHDGMDLGGFQRIFWLEYAHRLWGRLIGIAFLLPLVVLWWRGAVPRALVPRLVGLFLLGGLQGAVGWFMVASGFFADSTAVSAWRLVLHLALALALYAAMLWTGLDLLRPAPVRATPVCTPGRTLFAAVAVAVVCTMLAGGFVAGLQAGRVYNTFPLMDGQLVPSGYAIMRPLWRNLFENPTSVQFDHRLLATATALLALAAAAAGLARVPRGSPLWLASFGLGVAVLAQYVLGIATLLAAVPVTLAAAHQACAVLLLTAALVCCHLARSRPAPILQEFR